MKRSVVLVLALVNALASCAGRSEPESAVVPSPTAEAVSTPAPEVEPLPSVAVPPPEPPPSVTLTQEVSRYGVVSVSVANRSEGPVRVGLHLALEREAEGEFAAADDLGAFDLTLAGTTDPCVEILSGAELRESFGCLRGDQRGGGEHGCVPAARGRYRFVATSCDRAGRTEGEPFDYP